MDTVYPEPTSMLYRRPVRKKLRGNAARYRTQPVTFAEIQEVDEENLDDGNNEACITPSKKSAKSEIDLNRKFDEFRRMRDKRQGKPEIDSPDSPNQLSPVFSPADDPLKETAGKNLNPKTSDITKEKLANQRPSI